MVALCEVEEYKGLLYFQGESTKILNIKVNETFKVSPYFYNGTIMDCYIYFIDWTGKRKIKTHWKKISILAKFTVR